MGKTRKFNPEERRLRNPIARDLHTPKYRLQVIERKRIEDEDGNIYFQDRYYDDETEE